MKAQEFQHIPKVVIIGPESTGKSTLSASLAEVFHTTWVPEYAREYLEQLQHPFSEQDLLHIAKGQLNTEDEKLATASRLLICDTDLHVIRVWSEHRFNRTDSQILAAIAERRYDLYLLTDTDIAWEPDPLREHPELHMRRYFYHQYRDAVMHSGVPWANIHGNHQQRLQLALAAIRENLNIAYAHPHSS